MHRYHQQRCGNLTATATRPTPTQPPPPLYCQHPRPCHHQSTANPPTAPPPIHRNFTAFATATALRLPPPPPSMPPPLNRHHHSSDLHLTTTPPLLYHQHPQPCHHQSTANPLTVPSPIHRNSTALATATALRLPLPPPSLPPPSGDKHVAIGNCNGRNAWLTVHGNGAAAAGRGGKSIERGIPHTTGIHRIVVD
jgi:hypothetical protein